MLVVLTWFVQGNEISSPKVLPETLWSKSRS
jgi:hypothetical protein